MITEEKFIAKVAKAIGDANRLLILREIAKQGSLTLLQVQALTHLAQPSMSYHIKLLADADLITIEKTGRAINLTLNHEKLKEFANYFGEMKWGPRLHY